MRKKKNMTWTHLLQLIILVFLFAASSAEGPSQLWGGQRVLGLVQAEEHWCL